MNLFYKPYWLEKNYYIPKLKHTKTFKVKKFKQPGVLQRYPASHMAQHFYKKMLPSKIKIFDHLNKDTSQLSWHNIENEFRFNSVDYRKKNINAL